MIALYPRVSTQEQALHGNSIDEQIERMQNYCKAMGWNNYVIYNDAGFSGANTNRPALQNLIEDVKAGKIEKVIVYKLDRLSRSQLDTLYLIEKVFLANNCDFVSINENFDTATPFGRAMIGILAVFAQLEREQIKERMTMGKLARAKKGKTNCCAKPPIGYDYLNDNLIINDYESMLVKRIYNDYSSGKNISQIVKQLNTAGLYHKYGKWVNPTVRKILTNKTYMGYVKHNDFFFDGNFPAIIVAKLFNAVQEKIKDDSDRHIHKNIRAGKATSYLAGLIYCQQCGAKYFKRVSHKNNRKYFYYSCNSRVKTNKEYVTNPNCKNKHWKMDDLDNLIISEIKKLSIDFQHTKTKNKKNDNSQFEILQKKIDEINIQISKLIDLYSLNNIPVEILNKKTIELNEQKNNLEKELKFLRKKQKSKLSYEKALNNINSFEAVLARGNFDEIRLVIETLIDKIAIDGDNITIYWAFE